MFASDILRNHRCCAIATPEEVTSPYHDDCAIAIKAPDTGECNDNVISQVEHSKHVIEKIDEYAADKLIIMIVLSTDMNVPTQIAPSLEVTFY